MGSHMINLFLCILSSLYLCWTALLLLQNPALQTQDLTSTFFVSVSIYGTVILDQA